MRNSIALAIVCCFSLFPSCQNEPYQQGKNLYTYYCESCHMKDGSGLAKLIPPMSGTYLAENMVSLPCIVKFGLKGPIRVEGVTYNQEMEGFKHLTDAEISNVINYVLYRWAPEAGPMLPGEVSASLASCREKTN